MQCDVFSSVPTGGNGLAVVMDGTDLTTEDMQAFAREGTDWQVQTAKGWVTAPKVILAAVGPAMTEVAGEVADGMIIHGGKTLQGATVTSFGDHRIAMAFAIAGLFAEGETIVEDAACVNTSYPGFESSLNDAMNSMDKTTSD